MCSGLKGCAGKRCLQLQVWYWDLRGVVGAGSPGSTSGSWCIPAGVAAVNCGCHSWGGAAWQHQGSWSFQHRVVEEDEWAGIWGALYIISKVVLISCAMHCSNTCQSLNFDISELLFATVLIWPEAVLIVSLQLICQGQTSLLAFFPCGFSQRVHGNRPLKIHVKGLAGGQPRWCVLVGGNKCTDLSIQELWNLIQMNKKWKNETTQRKLL